MTTTVLSPVCMGAEGLPGPVKGPICAGAGKSAIPVHSVQLQYTGALLGDHAADVGCFVGLLMENRGRKRFDGALHHLTPHAAAGNGRLPMVNGQLSMVSGQ
ncbi:MAG: hypothetical protein M9936_12130 [Caldilinea sp.]|nr:hypothetical protein [Caldilinea sp.]MCB0058511.1 hypothetical protein [Caldilineaceae bacterium]MCB0052270.1 hypothetical protein [Caldilinea sp.]MCB0146167.1 hypothetical protein [Caldilineaceae bacterium]MCO5210439.1 hypothetical protein [Caldilinea sp.]